MADVGELVKLGDGRWARYQHLSVVSDGGPSGIALLVAVELDERTQRLLDAAELTTGIDAPARRDDAELTLPREAAQALTAAVH